MVYTKTGDDGTTSLVGGSRVEKDDPRVEAYGTVDELGAHLAVLAESVKEDKALHASLKTIQQHLFTIQTLLATEDCTLAQRLPQLNEDQVHWIENQIDAIEATLPRLHSFVLPGGSMAGAISHVARCVCRRAERNVVSMKRQYPDAPIALSQVYLNRLSDWLFVVSRMWTLSHGEEVCVSVS